eukprot:g36223.t1
MKEKDVSPKTGGKRGEERRSGHHQQPRKIGNNHNSINRNNKNHGNAKRARNISGKRTNNRDYDVYPPNRTTNNLSLSSASSRTSRTERQPAEYKTLKISNLGSQLSDGAIEDGLFHEFKKFGDSGNETEIATNSLIIWIVKSGIAGLLNVGVTIFCKIGTKEGKGEALQTHAQLIVLPAMTAPESDDAFPRIAARVIAVVMVDATVIQTVMLRMSGIRPVGIIVTAQKRCPV